MGMTFDDDGFGGKMENIVSDTQEKDMPDIVQGILEIAFAESQDLVLVKSGRLQSSGYISDMVQTGLKQEAGIIYNTPYAAIIEFKKSPYLRPPMARAKIKAELARLTGLKLTSTFKKYS